MTTRHPVLRTGDSLRVAGQAHMVVSVAGSSIQLVNVIGATTEITIGELLADPSLELVCSSRVPSTPQAALERLPAEAVQTAQWWEHHVLEVLTGTPPDVPAGATPSPQYDPQRRSLRQRELAKVDELAEQGHVVAHRRLQRLRQRYENEGLLGLVDRRAAGARRLRPDGRVDPQIVDATRRAICEETDRSTGTVLRLRRRVEQLLAEQPEPPSMPSTSTFYRLVDRLAAGKHTFGSARTRRTLAKQPDGPFGQIDAARPGEWMQIDSTPLDVRVVHDDGTIDRVELTGLVDQATRTIAAAVLRPTTKAVDAALLLARALTPEPMRPGWTDALRLSRSVLPHRSLTAIDARLEHAAARPVITPENIVCDHGKAYLSATFRTACRSLGVNLQPAHPDTPTDKPVIERTLGSVASLFAQYVAGYVGPSVERRGRDAEAQAVWSMVELQALLDEWIVAVWQNRPHDGLRDPVAPDHALTPNERYAALVAVAGYVPVPLGPEDYIELLPVEWRAINSYGIKIDLRTYDSEELNPYRRQHSGIEAKNGRWEVHHDPYDVSRVWVRNHHHGGWLSVTWKHLRTAPVPFGETAWAHARELLANRGADPTTEAEIATAAAELLTRAETGPAPTDQAHDQRSPAKQATTRTRRVRGRTAATATPLWPRAVPDPPEDPVTIDEEPPAEVPPAPVVALPLFDARKEAEKWW